MKTILWIIILGIIFLTIFRFLRKVFAVKKVFQEARNAYNQNQNSNDSHRESQENTSFDKPKYNIDAETVDYEIIEEKKDEK